MSDHDWPVRESVTEYETGWFTGGYDLVEQPDGTEKRYYWATLPPATVVVARTDDAVVFVEQYRPTIRQTQLELPAGIVEPDDGLPDDRPATLPAGDGHPVPPAAYERAAARELREETGYDPGEVTHLQSYMVATGLLRHPRGMVFAHDLADAERELDSNEFLTVREVPVAEAVAAGREQPTNDATVEGLLLADAAGLLS